MLELLALAALMNLEYNLIPSLHVALTVTCIGAYLPHATGWTRHLLPLWAFLVAVSTVLTHQHHVLDVVTGLLLGLAGAAAARRNAARAR